MTGNNNPSSSFPSIKEDEPANTEYGDATPGQRPKNRKTSSGRRLRISGLPHNLRASAIAIDEDGDGVLDIDDFVGAIRSLDNKQRENRTLKHVLYGFIVMTVLLVACIFGATITAARLSKDVTVDTFSGFAYVKGSETSVMKTSRAIVYESGFSVVDLDNEELDRLTVLVFNDGDVKLNVQGYARDSVNDLVVLLVQGGTVTFGANGIVDSTGDVTILLTTTNLLLEDSSSTTGDGRRELGFVGCSFSYGGFDKD
jgi:hypothetical protein